MVAWSDGGAARRAARHPISGAERVARFFAKVTRTALDEGVTGRMVRANGALAVAGIRGAEIDSIVTFEIRDGSITALRSILNPDKLPSGDRGMLHRR